MTIQPGANVYTQGFGSRPENVEVPHIDVRAPAATDVLYPIGKPWIDRVNQNAYVLVSLTTSQGVVSAVWVETGGSTGAISSVVGTANQVTVSTTSGVATVGLANPLVTPGPATITGNLTFPNAGNKIISTSVGSGTAAGANSFGTVTLTAGTATVATTAVTANSIIFLTRESVGASTALGQLTVGTVSAGTSFVINAATQATPGTPLAADVSVVGWMIVN